VSVGKKDEPKVAGHGIQNRCLDIPDSCLDIPNRCNTLPKGDHGNYVKIKNENGQEVKVKDGEWTTVADNLFWVETYSLGIRQGPQGMWNIKDCSARSDHGSYQNGKKEGTWTSIDRNIGYEYFVTANYANGILEGPKGGWKISTCRPTGSHGTYRNGKEEGTWITVDGNS